MESKAKGDFQLLKELADHEKSRNCDICQKHCPAMTSMKLLHQISYTSKPSTDTPKSLQVELYGQLSKKWSVIPGLFLLQDRLVNGFPLWKHKNSHAVIWYDNLNDHWSMSDTTDLGNSNWIFAGPKQNDEMPHLISLPWRYKSRDMIWKDLSNRIKSKQI